jgi:hypothetical protein
MPGSAGEWNRPLDVDLGPHVLACERIALF